MCKRALSRFVAACAALVLWAGVAHAQVGSTTDLIIGRVVGPDTLPLKRARVTVTSVESGISRNTSTNDEGRFTVVFPDGGGQYVVTAQYLGMFPERTMVRRTADEDRLVADFRLAASPVVLQAIRVLASQLGDTALARAGASGKVVSRELLDRLGYLNDDATAIAMITPGVALTPGSDSSLASISIGGQPPSRTAHTVDGVAGGGSLPREAVKNTTVITSEYDVSQGRFTGGWIDQQTISGTNMFRAGVNTSTPLAPIGSSGGPGVLLQRQSGFDAGGNVSGPVQKNHLFFAGAFHVMHLQMPGMSAYSIDPAALDRLGVTPDSLTRFLSILNNHGLGAGTGFIGNRFTNQSGFARVDYTPDEHNTITISANSNEYASRGPFAGPLSTGTSVSEWMLRGSRAFIALTSHAGSWVNDARVSGSWTRDGNTATHPAASGVVVVPSTAPTPSGTPATTAFQFGGYGGGSNITRESSFEAKDELSRLSSDGAHRVKLGLDLLLSHSTGGLPSNLFGSYEFNSLADLEAGRPASFTRTLARADRRSSVVDAAAYLGDAWRVGPQLQLIYGARIDQATFLDAPALNPAALAEFGIRTDHFPRETGVSPRIGFTYLPHAGNGKEPLATIRGGVGMFRSGGGSVAPYFASARDATGLPGAVARLSCVGTSVPAVDWNVFTSTSTPAPTECDGAALTTPTAAPSVTLIDPSLRVPKTVRASLSVSRTIHKTWDAEVDASLTNESDGTGLRDANLVSAPRFTLANEDGRPVYVAPGAIVPNTGAVALAASRLDPQFGVVALTTSDLQSREREISLSLGHRAKKMMFNVSYTHAWSKDREYATIPDAIGYDNSPPTAGDPRVARWIQGQWPPPNQLRVFGTYTPSSWIQISPSLWAQNGYHFGPMVNGDVNGDGVQNDLAFVFDPAHTADTSIANGMQRLLASASPRIRDCLASQLGRIAAPRSCQTPWYVSGGVSVQLTPPWEGKRLTLALQLNNVLSGADMLLHGADHLHGWGAFFPTDQRLLYVRGFDPATQQFKYAVNERFGVARPSQTFYVRPLQLTLQARLNLGSTGGPMMMGGPPGATPGAAKSGLSADTLRARLARTIPNPFRSTIALKDSLALALDSTQLATLKTKGDAFQPRADSIVTQLATILSAPLTGPSASDVATRVRSATEAGQTLEKSAISELHTILTDAQFAKLPPSVTKPSASAPAPAAPPSVKKSP